MRSIAKVKRQACYLVATYQKDIELWGGRHCCQKNSVHSFKVNTAGPSDEACSQMCIRMAEAHRRALNWPNNQAFYNLRDDISNASGENALQK